MVFQVTSKTNKYVQKQYQHPILQQIPGYSIIGLYKATMVNFHKAEG